MGILASIFGTPTVSMPAREILDREFVSSDFVRFEVSPKAIYHRREAQASFYAAFFDTVAIWVPASQSLTHLAYEQAQP